MTIFLVLEISTQIIASLYIFVLPLQSHVAHILTDYPMAHFLIFHTDPTLFAPVYPLSRLIHTTWVWLKADIEQSQKILEQLSAYLRSIAIASTFFMFQVQLSFPYVSSIYFLQPCKIFVRYLQIFTVILILLPLGSDRLISKYPP